MTIADQLREIIDLLYMHGEEDCEVHIGIWDNETVPYTYYATLNDRDGNTQAGENSYDSLTLEEAVALLYADMSGNCGQCGGTGKVDSGAPDMWGGFYEVTCPACAARGENDANSSSHCA